MAARGYQSRAKSISHEWAIYMLSALEDKIRIPKRRCNILYFLQSETELLFKDAAQADRHFVLLNRFASRTNGAVLPVCWTPWSRSASGYGPIFADLAPPETNRSFDQGNKIPL